MKKQSVQILTLILALLLSALTQLSPASASDSQINGLVKRLNSKGALWTVNDAAINRVGIMMKQRLGLYQIPNAVIECNLRQSGTWLFVYKSTNAGYKAAGSQYFVRESYYDVEILIDPKTNYVVLLHTAVGGNQKCLNSAYNVLSLITD